MDRKQAKFCVEIMRTGNATEAYKAAGYKPRNDAVAAAAASKLLRKDKVRERIEELRKKMDGEKIMDALERRELLSSIARDRQHSPQDRIRAVDIMNKMDCIYTNKQEISGKNGGDIRYCFYWKGDHGQDSEEEE